MKNLLKAMTVFCMAALLFSGCAAPRPTGNAVVVPLNSNGYQCDTWEFAGIDGLKITTPRYHVFSTARREFALRMAAFMEAAADQYDLLTGLGSNANATKKPRKKMKVYILATRQQWAALTERVTGSSSSAALKIRSGGYCVRGICVFWDIGTISTARVAVHEGLHQYLTHRLYHRLPDWADEALAVACEGFELQGKTGEVAFNTADNHGRRTALRTVIFAGRMRSVEQLVSMGSMENIEIDPLHGTDYYAQLWALGEMLRNDPRYADSFKRFCAAAAAGKLRQELGISKKDWSKAVRSQKQYTRTTGKPGFVKFVLGGNENDLDKFETEYLAYARKLAGID